MHQAFKYLEALINNRVRTLALDMGNEAHAAAVTFIQRVIETLRLRHAIQNLSTPVIILVIVRPLAVIRDVEPFAFLLFSMTESDKRLHNGEADRRSDRRPQDSDDDRGSLDAQLATNRVVLGASPAECRRRDDRGSQRTDNSSKTMNPENVKRVVEFQLVFEVSDEDVAHQRRQYT